MIRSLIIILILTTLIFSGCSDEIGSDYDLNSEDINNKEESNTLENVKENILEETAFNRSLLIEKFYQKVNEARIENEFNELNISRDLEIQSQECLEVYFEEECEIEAYQEGITWEIPWHSNVDGCGFASTSSSNVNCLMKSMEEDKDPRTRVYNDLLSREMVGVDVIYERGMVIYSMTME